MWDLIELVKKPVNSNMSLVQADMFLRNRQLRQWEQLKDHHFANFIYLDINTLEDVNAFLVKLDKDNEDHTRPGPFRWGCSKAKGIRSYFENDFWKESVSRLRHAISCNRRICCSCHELGSFKRRDELPVNHPERFTGHIKGT